MDDLPLLYGITGISSMVFSPLIGRASDQLGKYRVFIIGSLLGITMVAIYVNMGITPFATVALVNVLLFAGVTSRMIAASAILTAVPQLQDRGAFMSVNASVQQVSGGIAAAVAGMIVMETPGGQLVHYDTLGYIVIVSMIICIWLLFYVNRNISSKPAAPAMQQLSQQVAEEEMV
jgi:MFS family permease